MTDYLGRNYTCNLDRFCERNFEFKMPPIRYGRKAGSKKEEKQKWGTTHAKAGCPKEVKTDWYRTMCMFEPDATLQASHKRMETFLLGRRCISYATFRVQKEHNSADCIIQFKKKITMDTAHLYLGGEHSISLITEERALELSSSWKAWSRQRIDHPVVDPSQDPYLTQKIRALELRRYRVDCQLERLLPFMSSAQWTVYKTLPTTLGPLTLEADSSTDSQ